LRDGSSLGEPEGCWLGKADGKELIATLGLLLDTSDRLNEGLSKGSDDGPKDETSDGIDKVTEEGLDDGTAEGSMLGPSNDGKLDRVLLGALDGSLGSLLLVLLMALHLALCFVVLRCLLALVFG